MANRGDKSASFSISLEDETSGPAASAGSSLASLRTKIDNGAKALAKMQTAMRALKSGTTTDVAAFRQLRSQIEAQKATIAGAQAAYVNLGGTFETVAESANETTGSFDRLLSSARGAGGPVGSLAGRAAMLADPLTAAIALATAGAAAFVALGAAAIGAAAAIARFAFASASARREEFLHLQGLTTLRSMYGVAAGSATDLQAAIDRVSDSSVQSRGEIAGMAESLYRAGLRGGNLADTLDGLALAQAVQGDRGAARFRALAVSIARTGGSVRRLADDYRTRLGGIADRQTLSLDRQMEQLHERVGRIFADVRIDGFLRGLRSITSLFSQSTATGRALHMLATNLLSPLFDAVGAQGPNVRRFFQGMVLAALRLTNGVLRVAVAFRPALQQIGLLGPRIDAFEAGQRVFNGIAGGVFALANGLLFAAHVAVQAREAFKSFETVGSHIIDGIVGGITGGGDRVRAAVTSIADIATGALRGALEIHSPSRVFADLGEQIPRGLARGVGQEDRAVAGAVQDMGDTAAGSLPERLGAAGGATVTFGDVHVATPSGRPEEARAQARAFVDEVVRLLEGAGISVGAA